jgi:hypothetical protein
MHSSRQDLHTAATEKHIIEPSAHQLQSNYKLHNNYPEHTKNRFRLSDHTLCLHCIDAPLPPNDHSWIVPNAVPTDHAGKNNLMQTPS